VTRGFRSTASRSTTPTTTIRTPPSRARRCLSARS
jgi:hypothetical protein